MTGTAQPNAKTSAPVQCDIHLSELRISSSPAEGTFIVTNIAAQPIEPLIIVGLIYFILTFTLSKGVAVLERRMKAGDR